MTLCLHFDCTKTNERVFGVCDTILLLGCNALTPVEAEQCSRLRQKLLL